jgi:hypothetical protein
MRTIGSIWAFDCHCGFNGEAKDLVCPSCESDVPETFAQKVWVWIDQVSIND